MTPDRRAADAGRGEGAPARAGAMRIVCVAVDPAAAAALQDVVTAIVPEGRVTSADLANVRGAPAGDCAIIAAGGSPETAHVVLHELRGRGFDGAILVVLESLRLLGEEDRRRFARYGVEATIARLSVPHELPEALAHAIARDLPFAHSPEGRAMRETLHRTRELIAAGEVASALMHRLNNPLAALLAEAQLLGLESLELEHASSVERIIALTRRIIELTTAIDDPAGGARV